MSRPKTAPRQSGFTIVELLVALSVTLIVVLILANFFTNNLVQTTVDNARASMRGDAQKGLDVIGQDIRLSANADLNNRWQDANAPGGSANPYSWQSDSSTLVLATAAQDKSHNVIFEDPLKYLTEKNNNIYFVKNGTLYKRVLAAPVSNNVAMTTCPSSDASATCPPDKVLLDNVSAFTVKYIDGNNQVTTPTSARSIELSVSMAKMQYGDNVTASYTTRMVFRND